MGSSNLTIKDRISMEFLTAFSMVAAESKEQRYSQFKILLLSLFNYSFESSTKKMKQLSTIAIILP
jgi:hypothetical protein